MDTIKALSKKNYKQKDKLNTRISKSLDFEIRKTQLMLAKMYKKRFRRKKSFTRQQASDFIAQNYRNTRYKLQKKG